MTKKMTETSLKKKLKKMNREALEGIISDLYLNNTSAEKSLNIMLLDDAGKDLLENYKKKLYKIFFPTNIKRAGFSLNAAKALLNDFSDICIKQKELYGDLALYFAECATDFTMSFGDIDEKFYDALGDTYHDAVVIASEDFEIYNKWKIRLENVYEQFGDFGWGMEEYISNEYYSIPWIDENN